MDSGLYTVIIGAVGSAFALVVKGWFDGRKESRKSEEKREEENLAFIRGQVLTPDKYEELRKRIYTDISSDFKQLIEEKDTIIRSLTTKVTELEKKLSDIGHRVGNVEQAEQFRQDGLITENSQ